jgi:hypothetical protein
MSITHVQDASATFATATSFSTAYSSGNTTGNLLIALVEYNSNSATPTISDTNSNSWTQIFLNNNTFGSQTWAAWYAIAKPGANTVQVGITGSAVLGGIALGEFSGVDTIDLNTAQATGSGTSLASNSGSTAHANELLLGFLGTTGGAVGSSSPFIDGGQILFGGSPYIEISYEIVNSTSSYSVSGTGGSGNWAAQLSSFYSSAPPPSGVLPTMILLT